MSTDNTTANVADIALRANDKSRGMTLDELAAAVQLAMRLNVPGETPIKVVVGWHGQIQKIMFGPQ